MFLTSRLTKLLFNCSLVTSMTISSTKRNANPAVRLYSLPTSVDVTRSNRNRNRNRNLKVLHIVRHAQGYHNVLGASTNDFKKCTQVDAELTPFGIDQCRSLSQRLQREGITVDCIVTSPMRRAIQTAYHSFQHLIDGNNANTNIKKREDEKKDDGEKQGVRRSGRGSGSGSGGGNAKIPFVACEHWRETVNFLCDSRVPSSQLGRDFPYVNFDRIEHEHDPIWDYYEKKLGAHDEYQELRESVDDESLERRARAAWNTIAERPGHEQAIAVVSHSAFFMHMFTRPELNVVTYEDDDVKELMTGKGFENCEMRSVAYEIL